MATIDGTQDYDAGITWEYDMADHLTEVGRTIDTATVTCDNVAATITGETNSTTTVTFHLATSGLTVPTILKLVITPTYDNNDTDPRTVRIQITNT